VDSIAEAVWPYGTAIKRSFNPLWEDLMRRIRIAILLCAALTACSQYGVHDGSSAEKAAIQAVLDAHAAAWSKGDAAAAAAVMTQDADWVSSDGSVYEGRSAIEAAHQEWLAGPAKGSWHSHPGLAKIQFIRPDVAIVDGDSYISGLHDEKGSEIPASISRYTAVMVKESGRWKVAAFRSLPQVKSKFSSPDVR
jgi:uncharacterized protein (TIGR02246 family)